MCLLIYTKYFFCDFPHLLQEWILRLKANHTTNQIQQLEWNPIQIEQLNHVNKKFICAVEFWLNHIMVCFIIEFAVEKVKSYSEMEKEFP
jgi:hypothetical protein